MVGVMRGLLFLVQGDDGVGDEVTGTMSMRSVGRKGRIHKRARKTKACTMSNWVVSPRRLSPRTMLGRKMVRGTSGAISNHVLAEFLVRA